MNERSNTFFAHRPGMKKIFDRGGTFNNYLGDIVTHIVPQDTFGIMRKKIIEKISRILPLEISLQSLEKQLFQFPLLSTADHHALLNFKLLYNSNLLYTQLTRRLNLPFTIVSATGSIPLNNNSHPRGFYFKNEKFNFFSKSESKSPVFLFDSKISADRSKGLGSFINNLNSISLSPHEVRFLEYLFFDCLEIEKVSQQFEKFSDQLTFLNHKLWKYYFDMEIRKAIPDMIYFQVNSIISSVLIEEISNENSLVYRVLFDRSVRKVFLENFRGVYGAWGDNKGTEFFWGISEKQKFIPLQIDIESNALVGENLKLELHPSVIREALNDKKIHSTLFFDFLVITFLEGFIALGGFNQLEYLQQMQQAHVQSLHELGMNDTANMFSSRITDMLICGMFPFDFESGIDLIWHFNSSNECFNGNLDRGLNETHLESILKMDIKEMISNAVETMSESI